MAARPGQISLRRPFYPARPGGTRRAHLYAGLGLTETEVRRRCDGTRRGDPVLDAGRQAGRQGGAARLADATAGQSRWRGHRAVAVRRVAGACWPGPDSPSPRRTRASSTSISACRAGRWSKRRRADRLACMPALLAWAGDLGVRWDEAVRGRVRAGCSDGPDGEDEFDAIVGVLGMIAVADRDHRARRPGGGPGRDQPPKAGSSAGLASARAPWPDGAGPRSARLNRARPPRR